MIPIKELLPVLIKALVIDQGGVVMLDAEEILKLLKEDTRQIKIDMEGKIVRLEIEDKD